jgi:hypothetical protein
LCTGYTLAVDVAAHGVNRGDKSMFEIWASIALLGLWSCVGVIYNNSRKSLKQLDEVVRLLTVIAEKK